MCLVGVKVVDVDGFTAENEFSRHHETVVAAREEHRFSADDFILGLLSMRSCLLDRAWLAGAGVEVGVPQDRRAS